MATQPKLDHVLFRPTPAPAPVQEEMETFPQPAETPAREDDNRGDRFVYALWMFCFALLGAVTLVNTVYGFVVGHR